MTVYLDCQEDRGRATYAPGDGPDKAAAGRVVGQQRQVFLYGEGCGVSTPCH